MIYDEKKMEQKVVYPTKQTPSYADWRLFEMGKELEEVVEGIDEGVTKEYVDNADVALQEQIDGIVSSSDVKDIVGTYAELQAYDTTKLGDNDIVKVLQDSTHSDAQTYYRWVITEGVGAWVYVGLEGPYYTKAQADTLLDEKQDTLTPGTGIAINDGVISNTLPNQVPPIASGDAGKVLTVNSGETGVEWGNTSGSLPITIRSGTSNPTTTTVGAVGDLYINTNSGQIFICRTANTQTNRYSWSYLVEAASASSLRIAGYSAGTLHESYELQWVSSSSNLYDGGIFTGYIKNEDVDVNKTYAGTFLVTSNNSSVNHIYVISGCEITISSYKVTGATQITPFTDIYSSEYEYYLYYYGFCIPPNIMI